MCGRLNVSDDPFLTVLLKKIGVENPTETMSFSRFKRATDSISIVREVNGVRRLDNAMWWLLLDKAEDDFKPSKYTSFNTRWDKLNVRNSAGYIPYRQSRCVIPAKGFGETEFKNKKPIHYYDMEALAGEAICFGGLYKEWFHPKTGEVKLSCSVITLPPHPKLQHIHSKAMPLILPQDDDTVTSWLDGKKNEVQIFEPLMRAQLPQNLIAYPINKPSQYQQIGNTQLIEKDETSW
jgi:putative SOS response-associated peptidase YedK